MSPLLGPGERETLLGLARASIRQAVYRDDALLRLLEATELTPPLRVRRGAFVSVKEREVRDGKPEPLRGCIGCVASEQPLYRKVIDLATKAAFEDPRFPPLNGEELDRVRLEISVLSGMTRLDRLEDLVLGRHGVQLRSGSASALFLPQVAIEHGWTVDVMLRQLALKAGLPPDGWKPEQLSVFEAEVFGEPKGSAAL